MQTTEVKMNGSSLVLHNIERRPALPQGEAFQGIGVKYTIYADSIVGIYDDGTWKRWWNKPTMNDALLRQGSGDVYKFNVDGSVEVRMDGNTYYWGTPVACKNEAVDNITQAFAKLNTDYVGRGYNYFGVY